MKEDPKSRYSVVKDKNAGTMSAKLNGVSYPSVSRILVFTNFSDSKKNSFDIELQPFNDDELAIQTLLIGNVSLTPKTNNIIPFFTFAILPSNDPAKYDHPYGYFNLVLEDAVENEYDILPDSTGQNSITVDSYNVATRQAKGHFKCTMVRKDTNPPPAAQGFPDTLRFTDGVFDVQIRDGQ